MLDIDGKSVKKPSMMLSIFLTKMVTAPYLRQSFLTISTYFSKEPFEGVNNLLLNYSTVLCKKDMCPDFN